MLTFSVVPSSLPTGDEIVVAQPAPYGPCETVSDLIVVVPPPRVDSAAPPTLCTADSNVLVTLTSTDGTIIKFSSADRKSAAL